MFRDSHTVGMRQHDMKRFRHLSDAFSFAQGGAGGGRQVGIRGRAQHLRHRVLRAQHRTHHTSHRPQGILQIITFSTFSAPGLHPLVIPGLRSFPRQVTSHIRIGSPGASPRLLDDGSSMVGAQ